MAGWNVRKRATALLLSMWGIGGLHAGPESDHYRRLVATSIYSANNPSLQTGWYTMGAEGTGADPEMTNANLVGSYSFGTKEDRWRPFVLGGIGWSKIRQTPALVGGASAEIELDSTYLKIGGGITYNPTSCLGVFLGVSGLRMHSDGSYAGTSSVMRSYVGRQSDTTLYDLFAGLLLHTEIDGYKPYAELTLHRLDIDYDFGLPDTKGYSGDLSVGLYTPAFAYWGELPVRARLFASASILGDELTDEILFDSHFSAGASLLWKIGPALPFEPFRETELAFTLQGTAGENGLSGWKAGLGFSIAKF